MKRPFSALCARAATALSRTTTGTTVSARSFARSAAALDSKDSSSSSSSPSSGALFTGGPAPPRLPKEEQEIFEQLQRQSSVAGAFSTPTTASTTPTTASPTPTTSSTTSSRPQLVVNQSPDAASPDTLGAGPGDPADLLLHPDRVRGARPEFEGERNPRTGEIGGPKTEPLRWGAEGEWTYNGRTTDF